MIDKSIILDFIASVRASRPDWEEYYTRGHCYELFVILKSVFPIADAWDNHSHVATWIEGILYDINGIVDNPDPNGLKYTPMSERSHRDYALRMLLEMEGIIEIPDRPSRIRKKGA